MGSVARCQRKKIPKRDFLDTRRKWDFERERDTTSRKSGD